MIKSPDNGPWTVGRNKCDRRVYLQSEDFEHDVRLYTNGDFGGDRYGNSEGNMIAQAALAAVKE